MNKFIASFLLVQFFLILAVYGSDLKPKYGPKGSPKAIPLALSNEYFRSPQHPAPAFWALISYYIPQKTGASCSSATLAMVLNAARSHFQKNSEEIVISESDLLDQVDVDHWKQRLISPVGYFGQWGISLDLLGKVTEVAFKQYRFDKVSVKVVHIDKKSLQAQSDLVNALEKMSDKIFIIANFDQKSFTDDSEAGHFAPVGAYDKERGRVLILDPDRKYFEPYWVSLEVFMAGMATADSSKQLSRGYLIVNTGS